jgi:hypothetical protein
LGPSGSVRGAVSNHRPAIRAAGFSAPTVGVPRRRAQRLSRPAVAPTWKRTPPFPGRALIASSTAADWMVTAWKSCASRIGRRRGYTASVRRQLSISVAPDPVERGVQEVQRDVHGLLRESHHLISGSFIMACRSADDRVRRMGLIFTTADWRRQICDGFGQPRIRSARCSPILERCWA